MATKERAAAKSKRVEWGFSVEVSGTVMASTREEAEAMLDYSIAEAMIDHSINDAALRSRGVKVTGSYTSLHQKEPMRRTQYKRR